MYLPDRGGFVGTVCAQGAWDPGSQTGIAVLALFGHVLEDLPTLTPMSLARITVDLVRPVPIGRRLEIGSSIVREGKKLQVLDLVLRTDDTEHVRARVLRLREEDHSDRPDMPVSSTMGDPAAMLTPPEDLQPLPADVGPGMMRGLDMRRVMVGDSGVHAFWIRLRVPVVAGEPVRATSHQCVGVDVTNCIGATFDPRVTTTINPDVTAQFLRRPEGEWTAVVGHTRFDAGVARGISHATLSDRRGVFAAATASQLIQPLAPRPA